MTPQQKAITEALDASHVEAYAVACGFIAKQVGNEQRTGAALALVAAAIGLLRTCAPNQDIVDGFISGAMDFPVRLPLLEDQGGEKPRGIFQ